MLKTIAYSFIVYLILTSPEKKNKKLVTWSSKIVNGLNPGVIS